jgi:hypothetical protein
MPLATKAVGAVGFAVDTTSTVSGIVQTEGVELQEGGTVGIVVEVAGDDDMGRGTELSETLLQLDDHLMAVRK